MVRVPTGVSSAQQQVLVALKKQGEASAPALAEALDITPSAVRQHLAALRSAGLVAARQERGRPGRPVALYHTTELTEPPFSTASADLTLELLQHIEEEDPKLVPRVFDRRRRRRVELAREQLRGKSLADKVAALAAILDREGYLADFDEVPGGCFRMTLRNCAIWGVASRYGEACTTELAFLRDLLAEAEVERVMHKVAGAYVCSYDIRPIPPKSPPSSRRARPRGSAV